MNPQVQQEIDFIQTYTQLTFDFNQNETITTQQQTLSNTISWQNTSS